MNSASSSCGTKWPMEIVEIIIIIIIIIIISIIISISIIIKYMSVMLDRIKKWELLG
jgi:hypothetical protein